MKAASDEAHRLQGYLEGLWRASEVLRDEPDAGMGILRMEILDVQGRLEDLLGPLRSGVEGEDGGDASPENVPSP